MDKTTTYGELSGCPLKGGEAYVYIQYCDVGTCGSEYHSNRYWRDHNNHKKITAPGQRIAVILSNN